MTTIPFNFWLGRFGIAAMWLLLASSALSAETVRTYLIEGRGSMSLSVPEGWAEEFDTTGDGLPPTIRLQDAKARVKVLITPIWSDRNDPAFNSTANIKEFMSQVAKRMEPTAVERGLPLRAIDVAAGRGYFFWATDRAPKPGEYEYLAQGSVPTGPFLVQFTILTHDPYPMGTSKGLAIIKSVRFKPWTVAQLARAAFAIDQNKSANPAHTGVLRTKCVSQFCYLSPVMRL